MKSVMTTVFLAVFACAPAAQANQHFDDCLAAQVATADDSIIIG
jgi:hypothetical protein